MITTKLHNKIKYKAELFRCIIISIDTICYTDKINL